MGASADSIAVAIIAATPPTIAALAALRRSTISGHTVDRIDRAVNHQPDDEPTLVQKVDKAAKQAAIAATKAEATDKKVVEVLSETRQIGRRLGVLERKVG
jgi:hypothetical protein